MLPRAHFGADFKFRLVARAADRTETVSSGVAVELESSHSAGVREFALFKGVPYVRNPAKAHGRVTVVIDPLQDQVRPELIWEGMSRRLSRCQAN